MDIFLAIMGGLCILAGFVGCIAPVLPGPPLAFIGLFLFYWSDYSHFEWPVLLVLGIIMVIVTVLDYFLPIVMTKKMGGTKYGVWGATLGMLIGLFFGLPGIILGPFLGALAGELIAGVENKKAVKAALGSFIGFISGTGIKLVVCGVIAYYYISGFF
jgi:Uncharacterized protein conserved in bacteria